MELIMKKDISKIILASTLFLFVSTLTACDPKSYYFNYDDLKSSVETVKLINYENPNPKRINNEDKILPFDFDNADDIESLESSEMDTFFQDLSHIQFLETFGFSDTPVAISVVLIYKNGDFVVISDLLINRTSYGATITYDLEGNVKEYLGVFANRQNYVDLVNKYFVMQIE
jgi:hypothetical protein